MKKLLLLAILLTSIKLSALATDPDSLKQQLQYPMNDTAKAELYLKMAQAYLDLKAPNHVYRERNGENAVNYTMLALHIYSRLEDTTGLKTSYAGLAKAYHAKREYTQAKWFAIQSSILAKGQKDIPGMISSLVELANLKVETGDYISAKKDLSYAQRLSTKYNVADYQTNIMQSMAAVNDGIKTLPDDEAVNATATGASTIITETPKTKVIAVKATVKSSKGKVRKYAASTKKTTKPLVAANSLASL